MVSFTAKIIDPVGLHARPASLTVGTSSKFTSDISIVFNSTKGNLKSIMNVMALGIKNGDEVTIEANGADEKEALAEVEKVMKENKLI